MYTEKVRPSPSCSCSCSLERLIMTFPDRQATGLNLTSQGFVYMAIMILMLPFSFFVINILGYKLMYNTVQNVFWLLQFETMIFDNMWLDLEVQCVLISKMSDCFYSPMWQNVFYISRHQWHVLEIRVWESDVCLAKIHLLVLSRFTHHHFFFILLLMGLEGTCSVLKCLPKTILTPVTYVNCLPLELNSFNKRTVVTVFFLQNYLNLWK